MRDQVVGLSDDDAIRETLEVLAEDIVDHTGFGAAVIAVRDSETELRAVVVAGDARVRERLLDSVMPLAALEALLRVAQPWGNLHFVPDASVEPSAVDGRWSWVDDSRDGASGAAGTHEGWWTERRWEAENALLAPLLREDGEVLGLVSVDLPANGLRPDEAQRVALSNYAHQAERTVAAAARRTGATHQLALAQAARLIVREAGLHHHVSDLLPKAREALLSNFALEQAWIKTSSVEAEPTNETFAVSEREGGRELPLMAPEAGSPAALPHQLLPSLSRASQHCWQDQSVLEISGTTAGVAGMDGAELRQLLRFFAVHGVASALIVPLGSGDTRLGSMVLGRSEGGRPWSAAEKLVALDIGHDIGRSMVHTLWFEAQERATEELREVAEYKRQLLMSMSHELQTPLASIRAHAELIAPDVAADDTLRRALTAIERGSDRLTKLVNNMLWLARVDDPRRLVEAEAVDLVDILKLVAEDAARPDEVRLRTGPSGERSDAGRDLVLDLPDEPVLVAGTDSELLLVCCNLIGNALAYTDEGGRVHVRLSSSQTTAEIIVTDDGIGIAPDEIEHIFEDFYRSPSPAVRQRIGTGLGLGIVRRIVARHEGEVTVHATPAGTRFRVVIPLLGRVAGSTASSTAPRGE